MALLTTQSVSATNVKWKGNLMKVRKCRPCGESSPYNSWLDARGLSDLDKREFKEPKQNDPLLQAILDVLDDGGEKVLTPKQRKAFQLVVREGRSERIAARLMGISRSSLTDLVKAGAKKLRILALTKC